MGIHQLHYLPWLRYFDKIARAQVFIVLDNIQFNKNGWQNRNKIKGAQGPVLLTVPVFEKHGQRLDEVCVNNKVNWRRKHWASIEQSYGKAPFFSDYAPFLRDTYQREWTLLNDLNRHMLDWFIASLGIQSRVVYASTLQAPGVATERLVNLIHAVGGNAYYSGAFALDAYLDAAQLEAARIPLVLQEWKAPVYPQRYPPFVSDLSVIDLLMNRGPKSLDVLLHRGEAPHG